MEFKGKVHKIGDIEVVSEKFKKRQVVIMDDSNSSYPQYVPFILTQDKCSLADSLTVGQSVTAQFNLKGKENKDKYYASLEIWKFN